MNNKRYIVAFILLHLSLKLIVNGQQVGFPKLLPNFPIKLDSGGFGDIYYCRTVLADFDGDSTLELAISTAHNAVRKIHVIKQDGSYLLGWPLTLPFSNSAAIAVGNIDGAGNLDLVYYSESLYVFHNNGIRFNGFPVWINDSTNSSGYTLSLYDVDGNGTLEIITQSGNRVMVINRNGEMRNGWPRYVQGSVINKIAVGDLNNDGFAELVTTSTVWLEPPGQYVANRINVFQYDGSNFPGWPVEIDSNYHFGGGCDPIIIQDSPIGPLIVINNNIVDSTLNTKSRLSIFYANGQLFKQWPISIDRYSSTISVSDMNQDDTLDIVIPIVGKLMIFSLNGYSFPTQLMGAANGIGGTPIGKVSLSNGLNIFGTRNWSLNDSSQIHIYDYEGNQLPWSPLITYGIPRAPVIGDLNNDGDIELVVVTNKGFDTSETYLFAWTLPGISSAKENFPWPMYGHDRYRTSQYGFVPPDNIVGVPISEENIPSAFSLAQNYPNPFNPKTTIHYTLSTAALVTLKVYDVLGREIATLFNNENKDAGKFEVQFDASNVSSGIYFYRLSVTQLGKLRYTETKKFVVMK